MTVKSTFINFLKLKNVHSVREARFFAIRKLLTKSPKYSNLIITIYGAPDEL